MQPTEESERKRHHPQGPSAPARRRDMSQPKAALRAQVSAALAALAPATIISQSEAVLSHLRALPVFANCKSASVFLPIDGGAEVDTWPIVADLLSRGASVAIPRVAGKQPDDLTLLRLSGSLAEAKELPRTKWGIPEPTAQLAAAMEDATEAADISLLLVPGVAFDSRCGRLGHGRGYYDGLIGKQRQVPREGGAALTVVGLSLREQMIDMVPMGDRDQRLDMVITPDGLLSFTSAEDQANAAALMRGAAGVKRRQEEGEEEEEDDEEVSGEGGMASLDTRCDIAVGRFKYACMRVHARGSSYLAVRSGPGTYHADVAKPAIRHFESLGLRAEALGGGRIVRTDAPHKTVHVYGYSVGFGGDEGGPPGRGMRDHSEAAELIRQALPEHDVTFSADGY